MQVAMLKGNAFYGRKWREICSTINKNCLSKQVPTETLERTVNNILALFFEQLTEDKSSCTCLQWVRPYSK
jgi:uncharacterized Zn finger protein